jgi:UDP-glucuronate decarboxylase
MGPLGSETYRAALERAWRGLDLESLEGKTVLIAGASGMLGRCLTDVLRSWGRCRVIVLGRSVPADGNSWRHDVSKPLTELSESVDYIIHAASSADPIRMAADPVGTLLANVQGTKNLLDYGLTHGMRRFLFVSSGEVYGQPDSEMSDFTEDYCGPLDLSSPRTCYPEGKRAAEVLCQSYISQCNADAVIVRPCHLFGPTVRRNDSRAVSEFLWSAAEGRDIVLKSEGLLERSHCYVPDAARGILLALLAGECGAAYNIANRRYQMRIRYFAEKAAEAGGSRVIFDLPSELERRGYSRSARMVLDAGKLEKLGWTPSEVPAIEETVQILRESGGAV